MKIVLQDGMKDCGICCLLSIIRFYGGEVPKEYLRELTNTTKEGVSLLSLLEASQKLGFDAEGLSGNIENIKVDNLPCIAHINIHNKQKHFVVVYKINHSKKQITLMDPAKGKRVLSFAEYNLLSSKNYLFLVPKKKLPILKKKNIIYHQIKDLLIKHKIIFIFIFIITSNHFMLNMITSFHFKYLLEYGVEYNITNNLLIISVFLAICYFIKNTLNGLRDILLNKWSSLFSLEITSFAYEQVLLLPYLYYKNRTTGEILSRFQDLNQMRDFLSAFFSTMTTDCISCIMFTIIMYQYNATLTISINLVLLGMGFFTFVFSKRKRKQMKAVKGKEDIINSYLIQGISNVDTMKGSHFEKRVIDKFEINYRSFQETVYQYIKLLGIEQWIKNNGKDILLLLLFGLGSYYVVQDKMTLSNLIIFQSFVSYYAGSYMNIIQLMSNVHSYQLTLERLEELFMIERESFQNSYFYLPYTLEGDIEIKHLHYKMGSKEIFKNLSLTIHQGDKVLLSGESGCGKSTLVKMMMRYIETDYHSITIAGIDINHYHLQNIRSHITYITSNEYLFQDTVKNNICMYQDYPEEEFQKVCEVSLVDELLKGKNMTPDSLIEENGFNFSNGERQRIILARGLLRKSNIYILDEALGQIDIGKEKKILENIQEYLEGKTLIVISHRFNNKKHFNRVLKLEKGVIIETKKV